MLKEIINNFDVEHFIDFFRFKNYDFKPLEEESFYEEDHPVFEKSRFLGEMNLEDGTLIVIAIKVKKELTGRSGKKIQYEEAKKILKESQNDAGIFIFYDENHNFRFSLVYAEYFGIKRRFSHYKRYTYFVSPRFTNKTFIDQIENADFSKIEFIKQAFSVEPVTKQFYEEIQNWYFWAMDKVQFPKDYSYSDDPEKDQEIRNATNLIRLITRIIFIWFLKEKNLVPDNLFDPNFLENIIKDFNKPNASNYYNAILQNLFFATLNQKMSERQFASEGDFSTNKKEYGVKTLYRYENKFKIPKEQVLELFKDIPFLNGGLFDCLDKEDENGKIIYIDGFSRNEKKQAKIPDYLFFQQDVVRVDLSEYGLGSSKPVRGLIQILKSYNFTIDENTPIDQEIALDPELLGKVFENLLASYNPETATTARKATGSYYTPREIVDYMIDESLKEYFKTQLPEIKQEKIEILLSYSDEVLEFSEKEKQKILTQIDRIKILDPACGSGAFPMGILHKLVHILYKVDPDNQYWRQLQYQKALEASAEVFKEDEKSQREEMLKEINEAFDESINYPDYARKLYLIENCIYGVDIQPIAIQISKLRFFISLVLDQKVDKTKENFGIRALPNLETKFVCANTLIGLEKPQQLQLRNPAIEKKEKELKQLRHRYFTAKTRAEKLKFQEKDKQIRKEIAQLLINDGWGEHTAKKIANFDLFDQNASADWFDPEWMFGVTDGFDIVMGNPPYVRQERIKSIKPQLEKQNYKVFISTADLYVYFYEKGYQLLKEGGILSFISSNKWMRAKYGENLRKFLKENTSVLEVIDFGGYRVFEQTVDTNIILFKKQKPSDMNLVKFIDIKSYVDNVINYITQNWQTIYQEKLTDNAWTLADAKVLALKEKIENKGKPLKDWEVKIYRGVITGFNDAFIIDIETRDKILKNCKTEEERKKTEEILKPVLRGRDIGRYYYKWRGLWMIIIPAGWTNKNKGKTDPEKFFKQTFPSLYQHFLGFTNVKTKGKGLFYRDDQGDYWWELRHCDYYPEFEKEKIVWQEMSDKPSFTYDDKKYYTNQTAYIMTGKNLKYILGLLNTRTSEFYLKSIAYSLSEGAQRWIKQYVELIPFPDITFYNQPIVKQIEEYVDKILSIKKQNSQANTNHLEKLIDHLVYKLYDLTEEEIKIIEGGV